MGLYTNEMYNLSSEYYVIRFEEKHFLFNLTYKYQLMDFRNQQLTN